MYKLTEDEVMARIASTNASTMQTAGIQAGAIVKAPGLHLPVVLVTWAADMGMWWGLPVATGDQPMIPGDFSLPVGIVPYRAHMAHPTYVDGDGPVMVLAQLAPDVLAEIKSASLDFLLGGDFGGEVVITLAAVQYRDWLIRELAAYKYRSLY